jgi:transposase-like protein
VESGPDRSRPVRVDAAVGLAALALDWVIGSARSTMSGLTWPVSTSDDTADPTLTAVPPNRWFVDETYVKVNGVWRYVYRAVDQYGQVIDVLVSARRDADAARRFFRRALTTLKVTPAEVVTDAAAVYPAVLDELIPQAWHHVEQYANNPIEADHGRLKHRLRPMRGLRTDRTAAVVIAGHAFVQNLRRGHDELGLDAPRGLRVPAAFTELAQAI